MIERYFNAILKRFYTFILKRRQGIVLGRDCTIDIKSNISILYGGEVRLGNNVTLRSNKKNYHAGMPFPTTLFVDRKDANIQIGNNVRINGAYIHAQKSITIEDNCVIASGVNIIDANGHELYSNDRTIGRDKPKEIVIGNNVWIGLNSIILKGTTIGDNSVVAAGSVVKGDFPANLLIQGNPAVISKSLNIK